MKVKQVLDIGALESEDGLVIIADDKDVWAIDPFVIYYFWRIASWIPLVS